MQRRRWLEHQGDVGDVLGNLLSMATAAFITGGGAMVVGGIPKWHL
jgi:hypothetical protein